MTSSIIDEENSLQFCRILDPVCSCGEYVGRLQPYLEFEMIRRSEYGTEFTDDENLAAILDDMGIRRMCCRRTIIVSPVLRLIKTGPDFVYDLTVKITRRGDRVEFTDQYVDNALKHT